MEIDCGAPGCEAGRIKHEDLYINPSYWQYHQDHHMRITLKGIKRKDQEVEPCDCPRVVGRTWFATCQACKGTGRRVVHLSIPKPGTKVKVKDPELLEAIFGDNVPDEPGIVYDTQTPEQHLLELKTGIGVRVTWDFEHLTKTGTIRKNQNIELWTFDLLELEVVK